MIACRFIVDHIPKMSGINRHGQFGHKTDEVNPMGTRATYEIDGAAFYCHFDGYPQGAAVRFAAMVDKLHEVTDYGTIRNNGGGLCVYSRR